MQLHIGIDDTDSPERGCTTYIAALLVKQLTTMRCKFIDYPNLLRLNPNAPWKTRGNGAICLRIEVQKSAEADIKKAVIEIIENHAEFKCDNTNPGVVFHLGEIPKELETFHSEVVQKIVYLEDAERLINQYCSSAVAWKNRRGLIGALASIGGTLKVDHTYELLAYRTAPNRGKKRLINKDSVKKMDSLIPETFNNIDPETNRILIAPRGADPVLYGVRGETPESVLAASRLIEVYEPIERWIIFRTNQGTDAHLSRLYQVSELIPRYPSIVTGTFEGKHRVIEGGHVIFTIGDDSGHIDCAAYEPSGSFRDIVTKLTKGDEIKVAGGVRETEIGLTLNLERLEILSLAHKIRLVNPRCPICNGPTESMGQGQRLRCKKCGNRGPDLIKKVEEMPRNLKPGLYLPPPRAERHLTKPLERIGREKKGVPSTMLVPWHSD